MKKQLSKPTVRSDKALRDFHQRIRIAVRRAERQGGRLPAIGMTMLIGAVSYFVRLAGRQKAAEKLKKLRQMVIAGHFDAKNGSLFPFIGWSDRHTKR